MNSLRRSILVDSCAPVTLSGTVKRIVLHPFAFVHLMNSESLQSVLRGGFDVQLVKQRSRAKSSSLSIGVASWICSSFIFFNFFQSIIRGNFF